MLARYKSIVPLWRLRMQERISLSMAEAEYYAASEVAIEIMFFVNLLKNR
jgi:hypothetical protein